MKKRLFICFSFLIVFLFLFFYFKDFICLRVKITDEYYIQQKLFSKNHMLKSKKTGKILENIYEWRCEKDYIYGSGYYYYYIYNIKSNELIYFNEKQIDQFYQKTNELGIKYRMDNCTRVMDYKMIN